eukprot:1726021-Pleurochrysis_carterae.AAC.1
MLHEYALALTRMQDHMSGRARAASSFSIPDSVCARAPCSHFARLACSALRTRAIPSTYASHEY